MADGVPNTPGSADAFRRSSSRSQRHIRVPLPSESSGHQRQWWGWIVPLLRDSVRLQRGHVLEKQRGA